MMMAVYWVDKIYWDEEDYYYEGDVDADFYDDDPCLHCGPHCQHWGGDNLCMLEIERQVQVQIEFEERYVSDITCPVCSVETKQVALPTAGLWVWPGDWDFGGEVMIALRLFGTIWSDKYIKHIWEDESYRYYHVWTMEESHHFILKLWHEDRNEGNSSA